jgi:hypothetical protein
MAVTRFEGGGPVARYWLANCEGFAVKGDARGVVQALIHDADSPVPTRLVVRTRSRRRMVVSSDAVTSVVPASRVLVVERRRARRHVPRPSRPVAVAGSVAAARSAAAARSVVPAAQAAGRKVAATAGPPTRVAATAARRQTIVLARESWRLSRPALLILLSSFRMLALEARASARMIPAYAGTFVGNVVAAWQALVRQVSRG